MFLIYVIILMTSKYHLLQVVTVVYIGGRCLSSQDHRCCVLILIMFCFLSLFKRQTMKQNVHNWWKENLVLNAVAVNTYSCAVIHVSQHDYASVAVDIFRHRA